MIRFTFTFSWSDGTKVKNSNIFRVDNSSSVHIDRRNKKFWVLSEEHTQGLDNAAIIADAKILLILQNQEKDLC